ncbi:hypothetical protein LIA77_07208 [Sarocladium implicatum]|nr:hypothetical protein LIA77_07208 [Sarocladium implicatum]
MDCWKCPQHLKSAHAHDEENNWSTQGSTEHPPLGDSLARGTLGTLSAYKSCTYLSLAYRTGYSQISLRV